MSTQAIQSDFKSVSIILTIIDVSFEPSCSNSNTSSANNDSLGKKHQLSTKRSMQQALTVKDGKRKFHPTEEENTKAIENDIKEDMPTEPPNPSKVFDRSQVSRPGCKLQLPIVEPYYPEWEGKYFP